jgi:hypothetical protein
VVLAVSGLLSAAEGSVLAEGSNVEGFSLDDFHVKVAFNKAAFLNLFARCQELLVCPQGHHIAAVTPYSRKCGSAESVDKGRLWGQLVTPVA